MKLTAVIICRSRREKGFERALKSVEFADEILVEERLAIADYAFVRNEALKKAKGEWVVFVDGDEIISEDLSFEIKSQISNLKSQNHNSKLKIYEINGFYIKRQDMFLGKWLKHGETGSVRLVRLARRDAGEWERPVHEVWKVGGRVGELRRPILHYSHESVDEMIEKLDRYSEVEAEYRLGSGAPAVRSPLPGLKSTRRGVATAGFGRASGFLLCKNPGPSEKFGEMWIAREMILYPIGKFIQNYIFRLGVLDGMEGLIHALLMSGHSFLVRAKILEKVQKGTKRYKKVQEGTRRDMLKKVFGLIFLIAWVAGETPRLFWKEVLPIRPMDAVAALLVAMDVAGRIRRIRWRRVIPAIPAMVLVGSWVLGLRMWSLAEAFPGLMYLVRTLVYWWLIWRAGKILGATRKWIGPAMAAFLGLGLWQYIFLPDTRFLLRYGWDEHYYRMIGSVLDPNYFGVMAGMILLMALRDSGIIFSGDARQRDSYTDDGQLKTRSLKVRPIREFGFKNIPSSLLILLSFVALVLTWSRASWMTFGLAMGEWGRSGILARLGILGILGLLGVGVWWVAPKPEGEGMNLWRTASVEQRLVSWNQAFGVWKEHPWLGVGFNNYGVGSREYGVGKESHAGRAPSGSWLLLLSTLGVAGGIVIGSLVISYWLRLDNFWKAVTLMVGVHAVFNNTLFYPPVLGLVAMMKVRDAK